MALRLNTLCCLPASSAVPPPLTFPPHLP